MDDPVKACPGRVGASPMLRAGFVVVMASCSGGQPDRPVVLRTSPLPEELQRQLVVAQAKDRLDVSPIEQALRAQLGRDDVDELVDVLAHTGEAERLILARSLQPDAADVPGTPDIPTLRRAQRTRRVVDPLALLSGVGVDVSQSLDPSLLVLPSRAVLVEERNLADDAAKPVAVDQVPAKVVYLHMAALPGPVVDQLPGLLRSAGNADNRHRYINIIQSISSPIHPHTTYSCDWAWADTERGRMYLSKNKPFGQSKPQKENNPYGAAFFLWVIQELNLGPLHYQCSALTN